MNSNDLELFQEMTRILETPEAVVIEVAEIHWLRPHDPFTVWHPVVVFASGTASEKINDSRKALLNRKRFFLICGECGLRHAKGHMEAPRLCMSCAEKNHGVVY
jgi:hypothetical protein